MKLTEIAVTEREKQLRRQATAAANPLIKDIINKELTDLRAEWTELKVKAYNEEKTKK